MKVSRIHPSALSLSYVAVLNANLCFPIIIDLAAISSSVNDQYGIVDVPPSVIWMLAVLSSFFAVASVIVTAVTSVESVA